MALQCNETAGGGRLRQLRVFDLQCGGALRRAALPPSLELVRARSVRAAMSFVSLSIRSLRRLSSR